MVFEIYCARYCSYLYLRDFNIFKSFFVDFKSERKYHVLIINKVCEMIIIEDGDVRKIVENKINKITDYSNKSLVSKSKTP
jgi:hypothetical protein